MSQNAIPEAAAWAAAAGLCLFIGRAELHTDDAGVLIAVIAMSACVLALIRPVHVWRWER